MAQPKIGDVITVAVDDIRPMPKQPRMIFGEEDQTSLARSLKKEGQVSLIKIARIPGATSKPHFQLIDGERRWRGAKEEGVRTLRAELAPWESDLEMYEQAGRANLGKQLTPYELIFFCTRLAEEGKYTVAEVARRAVLNIKTTEFYLRLGRFLHPEVLEMLHPNRAARERLRMMTALSLCADPHEDQLELAPQLLGLTTDQGAAVIRAYRERKALQEPGSHRRFTGNVRTGGQITLRDRKSLANEGLNRSSGIRDEDLLPQRGRRPSDDFYSFSAALERLLVKSTTFRFEEKQFRAMFKGRDPEDRNDTLRRIRQIKANLQTMEARLKAIAPK